MTPETMTKAELARRAAEERSATYRNLPPAHNRVGVHRVRVESGRVLVPVAQDTPELVAQRQADLLAADSWHRSMASAGLVHRRYRP